MSTLWAALLLAGQLVDGHVHAAPHGGVIAHAGPYHLETVVDEDRMDVWVLDGNLKTVAPPGPLAATLRFKQSDRAAQRVTFTASGDHLHADVPLAGLPSMNVELRLDAAGKPVRASFRFTALDSRHRLDDGLDR
jgi:hypothetical protein